MIYELRQYTLHPGKRDDLIELFERALIAGQEDAGMTLVGYFRQVDAPDRFVWIRSFPNMESRRKSLEAFYFGPVWQEHREAANATMIDSDNVLLLNPIVDFRPAASTGQIVVTVLEEEPSTSDAIALLRTEHSENTFPALPVREGENVFVLVTGDRVQTEAKREELILIPGAKSRLA